MKQFKKSTKLDNVCYEIRGEVMRESILLEKAGHELIKLNIGNLGAFDFQTPAPVIKAIANNINTNTAQGYSPSQGIIEAREAIVQEMSRKGVNNIELDDIYIGNGVSELIGMTMQGLLNNGDEILIPAPDYPLWTATATLAGGNVVHYICDEENDWNPDIEDIRKKITPKTKGIVVINPNNPTGGVYSKEILSQIVKLAEENGLIIFADEIYDKIIYGDAVHIPMSTLVNQTLCITFNGLSKVYKACGFRAGWMVLSGDKKIASDYIDGLNILSNMRLCSNVPAQFGIAPALNLKESQTMMAMTAPGGRLTLQRDVLFNGLTSLPGISCRKPKGALYLFPRIDRKRYNITNDTLFIYDLLKATHVLAVQGTGFNWPEPNHFRVLFLPQEETLHKAIDLFRKFLEEYRQN